VSALRCILKLNPVAARETEMAPYLSLAHGITLRHWAAALSRACAAAPRLAAGPMLEWLLELQYEL